MGDRVSLDPRAIREAIVTQLRANIERDVNVYPYPPDSPVFPCVIVHAGDTPGGGGEYLNYHGTFVDVPFVTIREAFRKLYPSMPFLNNESAEPVGDFAREAEAENAA